MEENDSLRRSGGSSPRTIASAGGKRLTVRPLSLAVDWSSRRRRGGGNRGQGEAAMPRSTSTLTSTATTTTTTTAPGASRAASSVDALTPTHQVQHGVDNLPIRHLSHLDQADQHGEFEAVVHRHRNHLLGPLDVTKRRALEVRHRDGV